MNGKGGGEDCDMGVCEESKVVGREVIDLSDELGHIIRTSHSPQYIPVYHSVSVYHSISQYTTVYANKVMSSATSYVPHILPYIRLTTIQAFVQLVSPWCNS